MTQRNWKIINANRKKRWESRDEAGKLHMLEEAELNKKAKILKELMSRYGDEYSLKLNGFEMTSLSIMRLIEWGLDVQWGIKVELKKYPGIRFNKLEGCAPIIDQNDSRIKVKLGQISQATAAADQAIITALNAIKRKNPEAAALVEALLQKEKLQIAEAGESEGSQVDGTL